VARKQYEVPKEGDEFAERRTKEALQRQEEREPLRLPKPKPVEQVKRWGIKPIK
jgi:hypothetical protein